MKYKLPREFTIKWLEALRSGEYLQGIGRLVTDTKGFCCIGVAGAICGIPEEVMLNRGTFSEVQFPFFSSELLDSHKFPVELRGSIGESETDFNELVTVLAHMNDGVRGEKKKTFSEIANWIETNVEQY